MTAGGRFEPLRTLRWISMLWNFDRDGEIVRLETRVDSQTNEFVLAILWCGQPERIERYTDVGGFSRRLQMLEQQLASERWRQVDNPQITYRMSRTHRT